MKKYNSSIRDTSTPLRSMSCKTRQTEVALALGFLKNTTNGLKLKTHSLEKT